MTGAEKNNVGAAMLASFMPFSHSTQQETDHVKWVLTY